MVVEGRIPPRYAGEGWSLRVDALGRIQVVFVGPTITEALVRCLNALSSVMRDRAEVIVDIRDLVGHNTDSRDLWRGWLAKHKTQLRSLTVVVKRAMALHRMVTVAVGLAVGIRIHVVDEMP